jgi:transposase
MQRTGRSNEEETRVNNNTYQWYVGIDWGHEVHHLCLLDASGLVRATRTVAHTAAAVHEAVQWLGQQTGAAPEAMAVAIETPRGALVDSLLDRCFPVFAINPKQLDRFRDRFTAAGAKDDRRDAWVLADSLRTDAQAFRRVQGDDPLIVELREVRHLVEDLQTDEARLTNRLRDQLYRVDAAWLPLCPAADEPWLWTLLAEAPDPSTWPRLSRRRLARVLRTHRIRRFTVDDVLAGLRAPRLHAAPGVSDAVAHRLRALVPQLQVLHAQRRDAEQQMDRLLNALATAPIAEGEPREHRDVEILQSLPGVGRIVTATMLTEAPGALAGRDYRTLRAYAGTAPVTQRSGKRLHLVTMRYACKPRLRQALYHWARVSLQRDRATRAYYDRVRARGHHHARALRSVADRWLRILVAMLKSRTLYDPTRIALLPSVTA